MKLAIEKEALKDALKVLSSSTKKQPGAITSFVLFKVEDETLTLKASDNFVYTNLVITDEDGLLELSGEGVFTLEEARLSKWISNVIDDRIDIELDGKEVTLRCGSFESPFPCMPPDNFPSKIFDASYMSAEELSTVEAGVLLDALSFIKGFPASSNSNSDPTGKFQVAQIRGDELQGTDSRMLGIYKSAKLGSEFKIGCEQIGPALAYLKKQSEKAPIRVLQADTFYFFELNEDSYFGFNRPRVDLPRLSNVPTDQIEADVWDIEKSNLKQAIGALRATADPEDNRLRIMITGAGEDARVTLEKRAAMGEKSATVSFGCNRTKSTGQDLAIEASDEFVEKAISSYGETISVAFNNADKYLKFREETEAGDLKVCLMTLRPEAYN